MDTSLGGCPYFKEVKDMPKIVRIIAAALAFLMGLSALGMLAMYIVG